MTEPNGFYYMRARYYDPQVGRFISEDPIGFEGGDVNLYAYVGNNPVNLIDPNGELAFFWHFGITYVAARNSGSGIWNSLKLAWNAMAVDFNGSAGGTSVGDTSQHGMGATFPVRQTRAEAIASTNEYIRTSIGNGNLSGALHAAQDLATPGHAGQPFSGLGWNWESVKHIAGDVFPSFGTVGQAYQASMQILRPSKP